MKYLLCYGTLRKHAEKNHNFGRFGPQEYLGDIWVRGYKMMSLGSYPFIVHGVGMVCCEIHEVHDAVFDAITKMEEGAGYEVEQVKNVKLDSGKTVTGFIYRMKETVAKIYEARGVAKPVVSGDWNILEGY